MKNFCISFTVKEKIRDGHRIFMPSERHEYEDELISVWKRRKNAKRSKIEIGFNKLSHSDFEQVELMVALYAHDNSKFDDGDGLYYVHPSMYENVVSIFENMKETA